MAETIGWLTDKILISELKIYHMAEQIQRKDIDSSHRQMCRRRLKVLKLQRNDLADEMNLLFDKIDKGKEHPKIYRQFKMYNDPRFLVKKQQGS